MFPVDSAEKFRGYKNLYIRTDWGDLDILGELAPHGVYEDVKERFVEYDLDGFTCRVLDVDALLAIKRFVNRDKDRTAAMHLEALKERKAEASESASPIDEDR